MGELFKNVTTNTEETLTEAANTAMRYVASKYRESLKAALAAETGLPSGIWHITIGNPKNPIVSCGDLVLETSHLKLGKELGYNDFPNEFTVEYQLSTARERGRDEIERIFNSGKGRVYTYLNPSNNTDYGITDYTTDSNKNN